FDNVNVGTFKGDARFVLVLENAQDITVTNNTMTSTGAINTFLYFGNTPAATGFNYTNNLVAAGQYGMMARGMARGAAAVPAGAGTKVWQNVYVIGPQRNSYPASTFFVPSASAAPAGTGADLNKINSFTAGIVIP